MLTSRSFGIDWFCGLATVTCLAATVLASPGCGQQTAPFAAQNAVSGNSSSARIAGSASCSGVKYGEPRKLSRLDDKRISESSGIARSLARKDCFWTHNDGNTPRLYCINSQGETLAVVRLEGADFVDCEDIASFTRGGKNYLLYADAGDNERERRTYQLHLFEEPRIEGSTKKPQRAAVKATIPFRYPDGSQDCEAVGVDPTSGKVYLATKEAVRSTKIYELELPAEPPEQLLMAKLVARLDIRSAAAMDISPDGRRAMLLTDRAAFEFSRADGEDWPAAFRRSPCRLETPPRQNGESICYGDDGKTLYLTSEGAREPLWEIPAVE